MSNRARSQSVCALFNLNTVTATFVTVARPATMEIYYKVGPGCNQSLAAYSELSNSSCGNLMLLVFYDPDGNSKGKRDGAGLGGQH